MCNSLAAGVCVAGGDVRGAFVGVSLFRTRTVGVGVTVEVGMDVVVSTGIGVGVGVTVGTGAVSGVIVGCGP